jgi:fucose 4-O-acetylase-like acetyltransferase
VIGHFLYYFSSDFKVAEILRICIYSFHIPAFSFISGYFARKNHFLVLIRKLLVPYIVFQIIYFFAYTSMGIDVEFSLFSPFFTLWYLIALFCWRLVIDHCEQIPHLFLVSVIFSVLIGFVPVGDELLDIYRIIGFFPFFVMGHRFHIKEFQKIAQFRYAKWISGGLLFSSFIYILLHYEKISIPLWNCQNSYETLGVDQYGWLIHLIYMISAVILIYAIGILMPKEKKAFTDLGAYTMRIYLCHGVVYKILSLGTNALEIVNSHVDLLLYIAAVILLVFALSLIPLEPFLDFLIEIPGKIIYRMHHRYS